MFSRLSAFTCVTCVCVFYKSIGQKWGSFSPSAAAATGESTRTTRSAGLWIIILLLLSGNIHPNPGLELIELSCPDNLKNSGGLRFIHVNVCSLIHGICSNLQLRTHVMRQMHEGQFLPSYEGGYFVLGQLDDPVYRIQKSPKTKVKASMIWLKPYRCRDQLDNAWAMEKVQSWMPLELSPPALENWKVVMHCDQKQ